MLSYDGELTSMTSRVTMEMDHYDEVPAHLRRRREMGAASEEERRMLGFLMTLALSSPGPSPQRRRRGAAPSCPGGSRSRRQRGIPSKKTKPSPIPQEIVRASVGS
jgi:hypothetical protein